MADEYARFQPLNEHSLQDAVALGAGDPQYTIDRRGITICVIATDIGVDGGATIDILGSQNKVDWGILGMVNAEHQAVTDLFIKENGTYFFEVVNASSLVWTNAEIVDYSDGTYNVIITGGCQ